MTRPIDLTGPQARFASRIMTDACEIKRIDTAQPTDTGDDTFNETTGSYGPAEGAETDSDVLLYTGSCAFLPAPTTRTARAAEGEVYVGPGRLYELYVPVTVDNLRHGDVVKGTASLRDPTIPDSFYTVVAPLHSTLPVARIVQIREITVGEFNFDRW